jgi:peroxin-11B
MANARKLFRLFKSLLEYKKINEILGKADTMPMHKLLLTIIPRIAFFFFWLFDHLVILSKIKVINSVDSIWVTHKWALCWFVANTVTIIASIVDLVELAKEEAKLIAQKRFQQSNGTSKTTDEIRQKEKDLQLKQLNAKLNIIKSLGDNVTATSLLGWPKKFFNFEFNDGAIGLGGLTSAVIACYNAYPASK